VFHSFARITPHEATPPTRMLGCKDMADWTDLDQRAGRQRAPRFFCEGHSVPHLGRGRRGCAQSALGLGPAVVGEVGTGDATKAGEFAHLLIVVADAEPAKTCSIWKVTPGNATIFPYVERPLRVALHIEQE
jgi:hypothetical protein